MKIVVLSGSPKGDQSVTFQYIRFLEKTFPNHSFQTYHVAHDIRETEANEASFHAVIDRIREAEGVLWAFPLYYFLVPAQYKRFIELIWERKVEGAFASKPAAAVSTSIHFFDHTAHNYIHAVCDDLGMTFLGSYSAGMYDLLRKSERKRFLLFANLFLQGIERGVFTPREHPPIVPVPFLYEPCTPLRPVNSGQRRILILTDALPEQTNLLRMVERLKSAFNGIAAVTNLSDIGIKGGCLGCIRCGYENRCVYEGKDGFIDFFGETLEKADVLVFAGAMRDRYLSAAWKTFFDRSFFKNHTPYLVGKPIGWLISGPLSLTPNLRQIIEAFVELQQGGLAGIVTDETGESSLTDRLIDGLAERLVAYGAAGYARPATFLGVGGRKIFRDDIYARLRFPFQADHRYYKKGGFYDFPQKDLKGRLTSAFLILLTRIPSLRREIYNRRMVGEMVKPLKGLVDRMK